MRIKLIISLLYFIAISCAVMQNQEQNQSFSENDEDNKGNIVSANEMNNYFPKYDSLSKRIRVEDIVDQNNIDITRRIEEDDKLLSDTLNDLLQQYGYIDTSEVVLSDSYLNNLYIDVRIEKLTYLESYDRDIGLKVAIELLIDWKVLDYHKSIVFHKAIKSKSREINRIISSYDSLTIDALKNGLIKLMIEDTIQTLLHNKNEKIISDIIIPKSTNYISKVSEAPKASVTIKSEGEIGSGFIISENGYIITNYNLVSKESSIFVVFENNTKYQASIIRYSKMLDVAILKIDTVGLLPYKVCVNKEIEEASNIFVVGISIAEDLSQTISNGIISGVHEINGVKIIQTDASINIGMRGGAIINENGELIGIVNSKMIGFLIEGVAFGVPAFEIFNKLNIKLE